MSDVVSSPHATWPKRLLAMVMWALLAAVFGVTGWLFGLEPLSIALGNWQQARDYRAVSAKVVTREGTADDGTLMSWPAASYEVDGKTYLAERLTVLDDDAPDERSNAAVMRTLEASRGDMTITVWVSPRRPEIALVSRDLPVQSLWGRVPLGVGFALIALAGLAGAVGALFNFGYYRNLFDSAGAWGFSAAWCGIIFPLLWLMSPLSGSELFMVMFVGFFALIGVALLLGAITTSIKGGGSAIKFGSSGLTVPTSTLRATDGKTKKNEANIKRGGMGGHGGDFDKR